MVRLGIDELTEKQKAEFCEWLRAILLLDDEEWEVFAGLEPMTHELFYRCMKKCAESNNDTAIFSLMDKYPDYLKEFARKMEEDMDTTDDDDFPQETQMETEMRWQRLMKKIEMVNGKTT